MLPLIATVSALLGVLLLWYRNHAIGAHRFPQKLQGFKTLPLIGNALDILRCMPRLHDAIYEMTAKYGYRTWAFSVPFMPTYWVVTSPENLEYVLKTKSHNFIKGSTFKSNLGQILGGGIFAVDGQEWYWQRKLASHIFSVQSFKAYTSEVFSQKLDLLIARLAATAQVNSSSGSSKGPLPAGPASSSPAVPPPAAGVVDLHDLMYRFTLDSFSRIGFGVDPGCLTTPGKIPFAQAFDRAQVIANMRFWMPLWQLLQVLSGDAFRLAHDVRVIRAFATDIINQRRRALDKHKQHKEQQQEEQRDSQLTSDQQKPSSRLAVRTNAAAAGGGVGDGSADESCDLLSMFMSAVTPDGSPLTEQQLVDTVINFIIAGRDTTAQALSWTFYLLLLHPEVQAKLLQEVEQVLGTTTTGGLDSGPASPVSTTSSSMATCNVILPSGEKAAGASAHALVNKPSYDQLRKLKYARAVFLEGLRLYPSVPAECKFAVESDVLPDGTFIPAGGLLYYPPYTINRLPSFWGEDSQEFRPERWLELDSFPSHYNYISFNAGPRVCLGKTLAELEGVYVLVGLLQRFRFSLAEPQVPVRYNIASTLQMKEPGLRVKVETRG